MTIWIRFRPARIVSKGGVSVLVVVPEMVQSAAAGVPVVGAPFTGLDVSINNGVMQPVSAVIDSGGEQGYLPSSVSGSVPAGTHISVYTSDGSTLLYSYTTTAENSPAVVSGAPMNTGNEPFALVRVYISYSPSGEGTTIFGT